MSQAKSPAGRLGRYENPWLVAEWHRAPPPGTSCTPLQLPTEDRAIAHGWLYARGGEQTVVCLMHPRANFSRHYLVPGLVEAGFAVLCINSRWLGNDSSLIHEVVLLDVAAALRAVRPRYSRVVLVGNSGGGSLFTFYLSQALAPPGGRLQDTAAGDPVDLNRFDFPAADAMIYLAAHPGEGHYLRNAIDPSVLIEGDPVSCDSTLDLYDAANGFAEPPKQSRYTPAFLARYRAAQRQRIEYLDAEARSRVERRRAARARWQKTGATEDRRLSIATDFLIVYRTDADPRCIDLSLDPSERSYGSLWGVRPDAINYGAVGFGRMLSPEAWLSTWSGLASRAEIEKTGPRMTLPCLLVAYRGDNGIFPSDEDLIASSLGTRELTRVRVPGDHYGFPSETGREAATAAIVDWLKQA